MRLFRKNDLIIIAAVVILAAAAALVLFFCSRREPASVEVRVNGILTAEYPLNRDRDFKVEGWDGGHVSGIIRNGMVDVAYATCPDEICVNHYVISRSGESIVCMPNRVVITISAGPADSSGLDAVAGE